MAFFEEKQKMNMSKLSKYESWDTILAKHDLKKSAEKSIKKLDKIANESDFEQKLEAQEKEKKEQRKLFYEKKGRLAEIERSMDYSQNLLYEAKAAAKKSQAKYRKESFLHRTYRLIKGTKEVNKLVPTVLFPTFEKEEKLYNDVINDAWAPVVNEIHKAADTLWDYMCTLGHDAWDIVLFIADIIIAGAYYITSFLLYLWDIIWDIRFALDQNKQKLFVWFSTTVSSIAVILILISSVSAYEYCYYGTSLGIAKSKQDVYQSIEILGDKLSVATGANVNIDVERDIEFKRVFGFKIAVQNTDDIVQTLTYMKDLQTEAYAISIDGKQAVILESEEDARALIARLKSDYAGEKAGVEYSSVTFAENITIDPVNVLLGDVWNPSDAIKYLETGTVSNAPGEDYVPKALFTINSVETATYDVDVEYGIDYIDNSSMYENETKLISDGIKGTDRIVATIERVNGVETSKEILSTTRVSNPINATYYQGTKPIPEKKGTGTWIWPLKVEATKTAYFLERYGVVGVSEIHQGVDYSCNTGTKIYAADGGEVVFAGYKSGYGYVVEIDHGGLYESVYGHCSKLLVKEGDTVYQGQNIALVGSTGISTGPHLHFEVRYKGVAIDPESLYDLE